MALRSARWSAGSAGNSSSASRERAERALPILLAVTTAGSVLAIGSVHLPVLAAVALLAFATAAVGIYVQVSGTRDRRLPLSLPVFTFLGLAAYTCLQALPLPLSFIERVAPSNADVWARALLPLGEGAPRWASISLNPGGSVIEALKWLTYGAVFTGATALGARRGAAWGTGIVFASAVLAAFTTVGHGLAGATKVFGLYTPTFGAAPWHIGPLLNPNTLAGYLNLGAMCGMGIMLMRQPIVPRWLAGLGVAMAIAVLITSGSRGGVIALLFGLIAMAILQRRSGERSGRSGEGAPRVPRAVWLLGVAAGGGALLAALGGTQSVWAELYDQNYQKVEMLRWTAPMIRDYTWLGIGRGAFESVFPAYKITPGNIVYTHAENFPLQWASEWGAPVAILALVAFGRAFSPSNLGARRSSVAAGAWIGLAVLLLQNLFDLALEIPAVGIAICTALGALWGDARRRKLPRQDSRGPGAEGPSSPSPVLRARVAASITTVVGVLAVAAALIAGRRDLAGDRDALRAAYAVADLRRPEERARLRGELRGAILRRPADPYFPLLGALLAWRGRDQEAIPWLQRTLEREPMSGRAHLLLADVLEGRGAKSQALLELRLAVESDPALFAPAAQTAVRWTRSYEELLRAVPAGRTGAAMLDEMGQRLAVMSAEETRSRCDREAIARDPSRVGPRMREALALIRALGPEAGTNLCADRAWCEREIEAHAAAIAAAEPRLSLAAQIRARRLLAEGRLDDAERLLAVECIRVSDRAGCFELRASMAAQIKAPERLALAVKDYLSASCAKPATCAEAASWAGSLRASRGEWASAVALYERAAREDPSEARWLALAGAASRSGAHAQAAEALEKVAQKRGGADPALQKRIDAERALAAGVLLGP